MNYNFFTQQFEHADQDAAKLAVVGSDNEISWTILREKVAEIEKIFSALKVPNGAPVIIYGHKESLFPVVMLACFHCNITYVPIDVIYPVERVKNIIAKTSAKILFNCSTANLDLEIPVVIDNKLNVVKKSPLDFSDVVYTDPSDKLQYIMFTSGSTGEPKGVQITRNAVLSYLEWTLKEYGFSGNDIYMNQAPFTFDVSLGDVLNAFAHGGTLLLNAKENVKDNALFFKRLKDYNCSVWTSTPSFVFLYLRDPDFNEKNIPVKCFLFMGEELLNRTCVILKQKFPHAKIINAYGPTEATIVTTAIEITSEVLQKYPLLPIGYPKTGSRILVDKTSPEEPNGELIIVGEHVSVGYLNNEELNQKKFLTIDGQRAFRTGDLGYYQDGLLFCIGRNDDQVKFHGYRIELSEITNVLLKNSAVQDACTVALRRNNEVKRIISFVVLSEDIEISQLSKQMEEYLPFYMVPGDIVPLKSFPYSVSYKVDKNKLIDLYLAQNN